VENSDLYLRNTISIQTKCAFNVAIPICIIYLGCGEGQSHWRQPWGNKSCFISWGRFYGAFFDSSHICNRSCPFHKFLNAHRYRLGTRGKKYVHTENTVTSLRRLYIVIYIYSITSVYHIFFIANILFYNGPETARQ